MQTGGAQVVGNDFGGGYLPLPLLNSSVLWKHCWNWWDPGQGVQVGKGAVLGAPDRAGKEEQDPSLRYSIRSCSQTQMEGSSWGIMEFQSRRNNSATTEEFYLEGKEDLRR